MTVPSLALFFFFFNDTATTEIYTLSLHDALPIWAPGGHRRAGCGHRGDARILRSEEHTSELQSRGLISYAVFCLKKQRRNCTPAPNTPRTRTSTPRLSHGGS